MLGAVSRLLAAPMAVVVVGAGLVVASSAAQAAAVPATVEVSGFLTVRSGPSTAAAAVGRLANRARVQIACAVSGQRIHGAVRSSTSWDRLVSGGYIAHAYVRTDAAVPACGAGAGLRAVPVATTSAVTGTVRSAHGSVNLRGGPSTATPVRGSARTGTRLSVACATPGEYVAGTVRSTTQWDRLTDGRYVSHGYLLVGALPTCAGAAAPAPTMTNAQFIAAAVPGAQRGWREFGVPPSVTIAQAILESGWGRSGLSAADRNYFGIKCFGGSPGTIAAGCHTYRTTECDRAGRCYGTSATFRTYRAVGDSFRDHGHFLRVNSRYRPAFAHTRNANKFLWTMWKAGYATDPHYYTKVTALMNSYQLYRYDTWR